MSEKATAHILLTGTVQMVGFRWFARQWAEDLQLAGWVKNNRDGSVECQIEGKRDVIDTLLKELKEGPRNARVDELKVKWHPFENQFRNFEIRY